MKFLVDTNVISELRKQDRANPKISKWVRTTPFHEIGTSVMVLAEIRRGIELKRRKDSRQANVLDAWFEHMRTELGDRVLAVDEAVAEAWALLNVPDPIPFIDGIIAATAKVHDLTVVTRNVADMARTGVSTLNPFEFGS